MAYKIKALDGSGLTGYIVSSYSEMTGLTGIIAGNLAYLEMNGLLTVWEFNGSLNVWKIEDKFYATSAQVSGLVGMNGGDQIYVTDSGETGFWNAVTSTWSWVP